MSTVERNQRTLAVAEGLFSYKAAGKNLGWDRIGFTLGVHQAAGRAGFGDRRESVSDGFKGVEVIPLPDGFDIKGSYSVAGLEETVSLRLLETGALRIDRRLTNSGKIAQVVHGASMGASGGSGGPVFTDTHIWRARYGHFDNVRTETFPWCRPEYPYIRPLPLSDTVLGDQESQAVPALLLTNDTYSQLLFEGQLRQDKTRIGWTLAAGAAKPIRTHELHWTLSTGGLELPPGASVELDPVYYQIFENTHPQDVWGDYIDAVCAGTPLLKADDILLRKAFYCSWNYGVFANISEEKLLKTARFIGAHMPDMKHFLIDDGWQKREGVTCPSCANFYLPEDEWHDAQRFPNGLKVMADRIREAGLSPAIWWTPAVGLHTRLAKEHPEWLAKDASGGIYRIYEFGYLDYSLPAVQAYLHKVFAILFRQWGFESVKMDFWGQSVESESIRYASGTGVQWRDWLCGTIRSYLPADGFLMTCVAVAMGNPFLGKHASTYRCSIDVGACTWQEHRTSCLWNLPMHAIPGNRTCLPNLDGIGWSAKMTDAENLHRLTYVFITMGSLEVDGRLEEVPADKIACLNRVIAEMDRGHRVSCPDGDAFTGVPLPKALFVAYPPESRTARRGISRHVAFFNWTDQVQYTGFSAGQLGLSGAEVVRDFWTGENVAFDDGALVAKLPPRSARLYEVRGIVS